MSAILVAYATKYGSTAEIGEVIGQQLRDHGHVVDVRPARDVRDVGAFDAVVLGGGLYMGRWHGDAMNVLKRHEAQLRDRPTWLFSSGPTGGTPEADAEVQKALRSPTAYSPVNGVATRMERIGARGHATFPGSVGEGVGGIFARWVPKGDWRDFDAVRDWADSIAAALRPAHDVAVA